MTWTPSRPRRDAQRLFSPHLPRASAGDFADFYSRPPDPEDARLAPKYRAGTVTWLGERGRMMRVYPGYASPREDNIFEWGKLAAVAEHVRGGRGFVSEAPYAGVMRIDLDLVRETRVAWASDRLHEYGIDRPFSCGIEELDEAMARELRISGPDARRLAAAERSNRGDLGRAWARVRDGNHRLFGALLGGCAFGWVKVAHGHGLDLPDGWLR